MKLLTFLFFILIGCYGSRSQNLDSLYQRSAEALKTADFEKATVEGLKLLEAAQQKNDHELLVKAHFFVGYSKAELEQFGEAVTYYLEGAKIARKFPEADSLQEMLISIYKNLGIILGDHEYYELAYKVQDKAILIAKRIGNQDQVISITNNKVHELVAQKDYVNAFSQINYLYNTFSLDLERQVSLKNKEGIIYKNRNNYTKALEAYMYNIRTCSPDDPYFSMALHNVGEIYQLLEDTVKAVDYYKQSIENGIENNLFTDNLIAGYDDLAEIHLINREYTEALHLLNSAEQIDGEVSIPRVLKTYELLAQVHEKLGNAELADHYQSVYQKRKADKKKSLEILTDQHFELINAHFEKEQSDKIALGSLFMAFAFLLLAIWLYILYSRNRLAIKRELSLLINKFSGQQ